MALELRVCDPMKINPDDEEIIIDDIIDATIDVFEGDTPNELLVDLINGLNNDTISDTNWFYLIDPEDSFILVGP